jgi:hypothetical protein
MLCCTSNKQTGGGALPTFFFFFPPFLPFYFLTAYKGWDMGLGAHTGRQDGMEGLGFDGGWTRTGWLVCFFFCLLDG